MTKDPIYQKNFGLKIHTAEAARITKDKNKSTHRNVNTPLLVTHKSEQDWQEGYRNLNLVSKLDLRIEMAH